MDAIGKISGEEGRLEQIVAVSADGPTEYPVGATLVSLLAGVAAQDDCAVYHCVGDFELVFGSDYVRGSKFTLYEMGLLSNYDIGYYLAMANISDVAAMGARPIGLTSVIRYTKDMPDEEFLDVLRGIEAACRVCGTTSVGGDIGGAERLIISASALGVVETGRSLRRSNATLGDAVFLTGATGVAGASVLYFSERAEYKWDLPSAVEAELLESWRRPVARVREARVLVERGLSRCAQDTSDGLRATLEQIARASDVGIEVDQDLVPVPESVLAVAQLVGLEGLALAASASVDFQLVFTVEPTKVSLVREAFDDAGLQQPVQLGWVVEGSEVTLRGSDGTSRAFPGVAWKQQEGRVADTIRKGLQS